VFSLHRESLKLILVDEPLLEGVLSQCISWRREIVGVMSTIIRIIIEEPLDK
jgi:hypothetical protein